MDKRDRKRHKRAQREARKSFGERKLSTQVHKKRDKYSRKPKYGNDW